MRLPTLIPAMLGNLVPSVNADGAPVEKSSTQGRFRHRRGLFVQVSEPLGLKAGKRSIFGAAGRRRRRTQEVRSSPPPAPQHLSLTRASGIPVTLCHGTTQDHQRGRPCRRASARVADLAAREVPGTGPARRAQEVGELQAPLRARSTTWYEDPDGDWGDAWYYDDELIYVQKKFVAIPQASTTLDEHGNIVFDRTQMTMTATTFDEMRKGCWDRDERVKDLTLNYTDGSLPFPTFPRFCGQTFHEGKDKELGLACVKANNDWMVEEWCEPSGGVNIPLCIIPLWDAELAAAETKRNAERGVRAIAFSEMPHPAQAAEHQHRLLGPAVAGVQRLRRHGVHARRVEQLEPCRVSRLEQGRGGAPRASTTPSPRWPTGSSRATCCASRS